MPSCALARGHPLPGSSALSISWDGWPCRSLAGIPVVLTEAGLASRLDSFWDECLLGWLPGGGSSGDWLRHLTRESAQLGQPCGAARTLSLKSRFGGLLGSSDGRWPVTCWGAAGLLGPLGQAAQVPSLPRGVRMEIRALPQIHDVQEEQVALCWVGEAVSDPWACSRGSPRWRGTLGDSQVREEAT